MPMDRQLSRRQVVQGAGAVSLGLLAGCGRWPGQAAPAPRIPRIGFLAAGAVENQPGGPLREAFLQGLREHGYVEGQSIVIEWRSTTGGPDRLKELASELVQSNVDVVLAASFEPARAAKDTTSTIPIVVAATNDPVASGLVASLARPGGNVTGLSLVAPQLSAKRLELLTEAAPNATRVAVLAYPTGATVERDWQETERAGRVLGLQVQRVDVQGPDSPDSVDDALEAAAREGAQALVVLPTAFFAREARRIVEFAATSRLPGMYEHRRFTEVGGLMSYGANLTSLYRRAAYYVDRILKGTRPADLPVEQPREFDFVLNLRTAQALGLTIPPHVLLQATEVIQ
jgi:putative tryptophan/tyrosine transport system substrate-binding protein